MGEKIDKINKQIEEGELVITDVEFLKEETPNQRNETADAVTAPTMATLMRIKSQEYMEQKKKTEE